MKYKKIFEQTGLSPTRAVAHEILSHHFTDHSYMIYKGEPDQYAQRGKYPHEVDPDLKDSGWQKIDSHTRRYKDPDTQEEGSTTTHLYRHSQEPYHHIAIQTNGDNHVALWAGPDFIERWKKDSPHGEDE